MTSYVDLELRALSRDLQVNEKLSFVELHVEPEKPRDGLAVFADGTDWDPGFGRGLYVYYAAAWNAIGNGHLHPSAPKCWAYVTVSAGTPTLQTSFNVTSITDTATGRLTVTIATDFSSANWCSLVSYANTTANVDVADTAVAEIGVGAGTKAAGSIILEAHEGGTGATLGNLVDPTAWNFAGFGDLV